MGQSDIFSHFGVGKDAKQAKPVAPKEVEKGRRSRSAANEVELDDDERAILEEEEDEEETSNKPSKGSTVVRKQPSIIAHGSLRYVMLMSLLINIFIYFSNFIIIENIRLRV